MRTNTRVFEDIKISVKLKLSALWTAVMFCYVYGDFFRLFVPGHIEHLMQGNSGVGTTTPTKLLLFAAMMTIPSMMIFLSLILKPALNRWINIVVSIFFTAIMLLIVVTSFNTWMTFYSFLGIVEIIMTSLILGYAWGWPK